MSERGKVNYDAYRKMAGRPGVSAGPLPEYDQLPLVLQYAWDNGADAVEEWLSQLPAGEAAGQWALVEQLGHRSMVGQVREVTYLGKPMLEVRRTDTVPQVTVRISPESVYAVSDLTAEQADVMSRTYGRYNGLDAAGIVTRYVDDRRKAIAAAPGDDEAIDADVVDDGYPDSERDMDALAYQRNGDDERDDQ